MKILNIKMQKKIRRIKKIENGGKKKEAIKSKGKRKDKEHLLKRKEGE